MDWTDTNGDGCPQANEGETGVPNYGLTLRRRENTLMDRGSTAVSTDACGHYYFESGYPMTQWLVMEAYNDLYYTTGVTYQADNQPTPTTVLGAGVDVNTLPIIGLSGTLDWGVHSYDARARTASIRRTAASSAPCPTTRPATSSTPATRRSRTGSRAFPV